MSLPPPDAKMIERVACALYEHHRDCYRREVGDWGDLSASKPDIAEIYRENAKVAIEAIQSAP